MKKGIHKLCQKGIVSIKNNSNKNKQTNKQTKQSVVAQDYNNNIVKYRDLLN